MKIKKKWLSISVRATFVFSLFLVQTSSVYGESEKEDPNPYVRRVVLEDNTIYLRALAREALVEANIAWHQAWIDKAEALEAKHLLDVAFRLGDQEAVMRLIHVWSDNIYGYHVNERMTNESSMLNDILVNLGHPKAVRRAVYGYSYQLFGYELNPARAKQLIDMHARNGKEWAIKLMLIGWAHGVYGIEKAQEKALTWNNERIGRGDKEALKRKVDDLGLPNNDYGYGFNPTEANRLVRVHAERQEIWALKRMAIGYSTGTYGFKINHKMASRINEKLLKIGYMGARKRAVIGYIWGCNGYVQDVDLGYELARRWSIYDFDQGRYFKAYYNASTG
ncbi:MAG: hypothetical protein K2Y18_01600 [Alphaproteobacteria bacterium]|nr:hypothetical protein [Alphaproteobacteria bacterium]